MSFLKKLGKSKTVEFPGGGESNGAVSEMKESKRGKRGSASFNLGHKTREQDKNGRGDEIQQEDEDLRIAEKEKERKKYKDMSGLLVGGAPEPRAYPTFSVHYLGRIPTSAEYGREAVEEPVSQLCKLREKQKLQRVFLNFNVEGLYCKEVSGPFLKTKKDGFNMHIPLHHITYGVGCAAHPTVFACIAKMNDDPSPENQVLVLHGFVCDKPETTQAVTYWQLQAYIEAYEDLKRKRILRSRRKQAFGSTPAAGSSFKANNLNDVPEKGGAVTTSQQHEAHRRGHEQQLDSREPADNNNKTSIHDKEKTRDTHHHQSSRPGPNPQTAGGHHRNPPHLATAEVHSQRSDHKSATTTSTQLNQEAPPRRRSSSSASQYSSSRQQKQTDGSQPPRQRQTEGSQPSRQRQADGSQPARQRPADGSQPKQVNNLVRRTAAGLHVETSSRRRDQQIGSVSSISSVASSTSSGGSGGDSPLESPAGKNSNKTFEKRIDELENLVSMDAEKLKKLMIQDHPTLARRVYYRANVNTSGVFEQGQGVPVADDIPEDSEA